MMPALFRRVWHVIRRRRFEADLAEEMAFHRAMKRRELEASGHVSTGADLATRRALGSETLARDCARDVWIWPWLQDGIQDARYAARTLRHSPGFATIAILTLALGIGATTTLFSVAYGVLLRPLPWADPDGLVRLTETRGDRSGRVRGTISNATYLAWRDRVTTVEAIGGWLRAEAVTLGDGSDPTRIQLTRVTPTMFTVLRARPQLGRVLVADDAVSGRAARDVVVLSYGLWQERFGGRDDVIGRTVRLDERTATIVGVMPQTFEFPVRETRAWAPYAVAPVHGSDNVIRGSIFPALARLRRGATLAQASAEGTARARAAPDLNMTGVALFGGAGPARVTADSALNAMTADVRPAILLLLAGAGLLLLTATANVTSLQLARSVARRREIAIRRALGAGAGRVTRQLIVEAIMLGAIGAAVGLAMSAALHRLAPAVLPADFPRLDAVTIDWRVALFAIGSALVTSTLCGVLPAVHVQRDALVGSLARDGSGARAGRAWMSAVHVRTVIMTGQVAIACVLLVGAGLLGRSFLALLSADRGYEPTNVLTASLPFPSGYSPERRIQILEAVLARARVLPGVQAAAFGNALPFVSAGGFRGARMRTPRDPGVETDVNWMHRVVSPGYFNALRLRVVAGRPLTEADTLASPAVVVVNRSFARKYLTDRAVGDRLTVALRSNSSTAEVVGIVDDVRQGNVTDPEQPEMFTSYRQAADVIRANSPVFVIRTAGNPEPYIIPLRAILREQDASVLLDSVMTMDERVALSLARPRAYAALLGGFAVCALAIAGVGLFGLLAYSVAQRTKEIGVRIALGALGRHIAGLVLRQALAIIGAGLAIGMAASFALGRVLGTFLYGISAHDRLTLVAVAVVLALIAVAACLIPARRATTVSPLVALRAE